MVLWIRVEVLIYSINFPYTGLSIEEMTVKTFFTREGITVPANGSSISCGSRFFPFLVSAVFLQTTLGQKSGFLVGVKISILAVTRNFVPIML